MADGAGVPCVRRPSIETPQHRDLKPLVSPGVASGQACDVAGQASPQARRATLQGRHRLRPSLNPVASPKATGKSRPGVTSGQACDVAGQASLQARHARRQASFLWPGNSPVARREPSVKWPTVRVSPALGVFLLKHHSSKGQATGQSRPGVSSSAKHQYITRHQPQCKKVFKNLRLKKIFITPP